MRITVLGWFGTETIGDRAIVAGLLNVLSSFDEALYLDWGSIFVPLTERSWSEDEAFFRKITQDKLKGCDVFYSCSRAELDAHIRKSDIIMIGGGPLIDAQVMYMFKYAFSYAKKRGIRTIVFGCGWGPLENPKYIKVSKEIIELADLTIFRDDISVQEYCKSLNGDCGRMPIGLVDPAFFAAQFYRKFVSSSSLSDSITINMRESFVTPSGSEKNFSYNDCIDVITGFLNAFPSLPIRLIPMHTFHIGGDDRVISNKLAHIICNERVQVQNVPMSLEETMAVYYNSEACCGMRFHAVLLQTVLNGRNYIMDYTEAKKGKIVGLLSQLNLMSAYENRYVSCENIHSLEINNDINTVHITDEIIDSYKNKYIDSIKTILS